MTFIPQQGYTHSGGEKYRESGTVGALTQQSASESSAMTPLVAVPLSHGSNPNSNMAGRRREDDENLVAQGFQWHLDTGTIGTHDHSPALDKANPPAMIQGASVRRLTPTECERLQALPDGWTNPNGDAPDSRRYAALGDAVTASVGEWIGRRILNADREQVAA